MKTKFSRVLACCLAAATLLSGTVFAKEPAGRVMDSDGVIPSKSAFDSGSFRQAEPISAAANHSEITLPTKGTYVEDELLVKLKNAVSLLDSSSVFDNVAQEMTYLFSVPVSENGGEVSLASDDEETAAWYQLSLADGVDMLDAWKQLLQADGVLEVQPNGIYQLDDPMEGTAAAEAISDITEEDPYIHSQEWQEQIHAPEAWDTVETPGKTSSGDSIVVAVVDSGVDLTHPDLAGQLVGGYNFIDVEADGETVTPTDDPDDQNGHGTHVAGIIAAANNSIGVRGVAYDAKIMPVRVLNTLGSGSGTQIANGIRWAADNGADIINLSLGGFGSNPLEEDAIAYARSKGILVVAAAGNESFPTTNAGDSYYGSYLTPANVPGVLTVMAMWKTAAENGDWLAAFSNYDANPGKGAEYEIMAPGTAVMSTYMGGGYGTMSGTSMACPVTAGAAAVLMGMGCTAEEAWEILVASGDVEQGKTQPNGTVNEYPALNLAAAVEMKRSGSSTAVPVVANEWIYAALDSIGSVDVSNLNTTSLVYFKGSTFLSSLFVEMENFGATGKMTVSGTVGGRSITRQTVSIKTGDVCPVKLSWTGTPAVTDNQVAVSLTITPDGGTPVTVERNFTAYDFALPSGISYSSSKGGYYLTSTSVTIPETTSRGYQALLLDRPLVIDLGKELIVEGGLVYIGPECEIQTNYDSSSGKESTLIFYGTDLLGTDGVHITGGGDNEFYGCVLYDPVIDWAHFVNQCRVMGNGYNNYKYMGGFSFYLSSFENCDGLIIDCIYFQRNLVNRCAFSELWVSRLAQANTLVENYNPFYSDSILQIHVPTYQASSYSYYNTYHPDCEASEYYTAGGVAGLRFCSVIGPAKVINISDDSSSAKVYGIYYQQADDPYLSFADTFTRASGSTVSSSLSDLESWGFASDSPVFATGVDVSFDYRPEYDCIDYELTYSLSTAVSANSEPFLYSYSNPMDSNAKVTLSADGKTCTATVTAPGGGLDITDDYQLAGICTANNVSEDDDVYHYFWATELCGQTSTAEVHFYSTALESVRAELDPEDSGTVILTWSDPRIASGSSAKVYRAADSGDPVDLGTVVNAAGGSTYQDPGLSPGHIYTYTVEITQSSQTQGIRTYRGSARIILASYTADALSLRIDDNRITASLISPQSESFLSYTVPGAAAKGVTFADQVKDSGLPYGAIDNGNGTVTIYIGEAHSDATILQAGDLFTLTPGDGLTSVLVDGVGAAVISGSTVSIWNTKHAFGYLAGYAQDGKQRTVACVSGPAVTASAQSCKTWKLFRVNSQTCAPEYSAAVLYPF